MTHMNRALHVQSLVSRAANELQEACMTFYASIFNLQCITHYMTKSFFGVDSLQCIAFMLRSKHYGDEKSLFVCNSGESNTTDPHAHYEGIMSLLGYFSFLIYLLLPYQLLCLYLN